MLELGELKRLHDKAFSANQVSREQGADDLVFYWVSQWDDQLLQDSQLSFRGEFNIIRKAGRQIMADLRLNPVQPDFKPKDEAREDDAELLDGLYRADDRRLSSQEAYDYATQDAVVCGFGAWELYTEYATNRVGDESQVIRRRYIPEANNNCFFDPNARHMDKSDANYVSILFRYSKDGYDELYKDLTGEDPEGGAQSFKEPEQSYAFPWVVEQEKYYVVTFYHRKKVKDKVFNFVDPFGITASYLESQVEEVLEELLDSGYELESEKKIERWEVTKYIASGEKILSAEPIAGENLPVIPTYGERAFVEGEEFWEGITRLAKDPQRLRNFQMSYLADIVSRSPRPKPIFFPEQVQGFEHMYELNGSDNNFAYLLQQRLTANGEPLPLGPVGQLPDQPIPQALMASIEMTRQAVEDVANPGLPQDIADPDLSGKAVIALQNRMDQQSYIYQHNFKAAKRRDAEVYAGMASIIFDAPKKMTIQTRDGTTKQVEMQQIITDEQTGEPKVLNDLTNMEFDVYAEIGQSYATQKQQTREEIGQMLQGLNPQDPLYNILLMKSMELMDGVQFDDVREYARKQLLLQGIKDPETPEEEQMVQQAQQNQQPDPMAMAAQAEMEKAKVAGMDVQRKAQADQFKAQTDQAKAQIDVFEAQTGRMKVQVDAQKAGADINFKNIQAVGQRIDKALKPSQALRARVNQPAR